MKSNRTASGRNPCLSRSHCRRAAMSVWFIRSALLINFTSWPTRTKPPPTTSQFRANFPAKRLKISRNTFGSCVTCRDGTKRGHNAPAAKILDMDDSLACRPTAARPGALVEPANAADYQIGAKPSAVTTKGGDGTVRSNQSRGT